ncbi:MAG: cytochrome-c oxidase, cbb3-type subunit III [Cycloclasticus sp.]|nr:cytochrome-c oxidase, cbb3-type subunit III [Cycloclasticus sp.]
MNLFWSIIVDIVILLNIVGCYWLIKWVAKPKKGDVNQGESTGHVWDGDLTELNNPMPRWWLYMFYITIVWGLLYLVVYPGFTTYSGVFNWTSDKEYNEEVADATENYGPLFSQFSKTSIEELSKNEGAQKMGQRLFVNYCSQCHASDAGGSRGYPNLTDNEWIWGGTPSDIHQSILNGRDATMPAWESVLKPQQIGYLTDYIFSLSGREHKATDAQRGKAIFASYCVACHQADGTGNSLLGAPNLADKVWLYGASRKKVTESIAKGRNGHMPANKDFLGKDKVHVLSAYVYGLSKK